MALSWFSGEKLSGQHIKNDNATSVTGYVYPLVTIVVVFFSLTDMVPWTGEQGGRMPRVRRPAR